MSKHTDLMKALEDMMPLLDTWKSHTAEQFKEAYRAFKEVDVLVLECVECGELWCAPTMDKDEAIYYKDKCYRLPEDET